MSPYSWVNELKYLKLIYTQILLSSNETLAYLHKICPPFYSIITICSVYMVCFARLRYNIPCPWVLLLLLLSHFSRVRLCVTPETAAHQAPRSLGFSGQEHWRGLPFPSPMHESEKWKWSRSVMSNPSWPHGLQPTRLLRPWDFPGKSTGVGCHCLLWSLSRCLLNWKGKTWEISKQQ